MNLIETKDRSEGLKAAGTAKFAGMEFRLFEFKKRLWVPLVDLAHGLGYRNPKRFYKLVSSNPLLFTNKGGYWIHGQAVIRIS